MVSPAAPVLGCLGAGEVTEGRTLSPPYAVWEAQARHTEWASKIVESHQTLQFRAAWEPRMSWKAGHSPPCAE